MAIEIPKVEKKKKGNFFFLFQLFITVLNIKNSKIFSIIKLLFI